MLARPTVAVLFAASALLPVAPACGQGLKDVFAPPAQQRETLTLSAALLGADGAPLTERPAAGETVALAVTARIPEGFYLVSQTSPVGQAAKLKLTETAGLTAADESYTPDRAPKSGFDPVYAGILEKFAGTVTWTRPFAVQPGDGPLTLSGELTGSYCSSGVGGACVPLDPGDATFTATVGGAEPHTTEPAGKPAAGPLTFAVTPQLRGGDGPVDFTATLPADAASGEVIELEITLALKEGHHIYAMRDPGSTAIPTSFALKLGGLEPRGEFTASHAPEDYPVGDVTLRVHHGTVTFSREYEVTAEDYGLSGTARYQVCTDKSCLQPRNVPFALGEPPDEGATEAAAESAGTLAAVDLVDPPPAAAAPVELAETFELKKSWLEEAGIWAALPVAFLGGLILNIMPCVLPVIALKAMSFAKQAGESRTRIMVLNLWYAGGVMAVFLVMAGLALGLGAFMNVESFGWGDQLNSNEGKVISTAAVFALGLSMLGLYEIPVPGFVGSAAGATGHKEGAAGAFLGGVFTTLLATPCTGPFLAGAGGVAVSLAESNPLGSVALWAAMGLGFASPYLVIAFVPGATRFLPRPGDWMVRFKEFGGLLLIATALWLLQGVRPYELWFPVLIGLFGLATGLWIVGRMIRHNDSFNRKYTLRALALGVTAGVGAVAYALAPDGGLNPVAGAEREAARSVASEEPGWELFDVGRLNELRAGGRTVLIEFTSETCINCRVNERVALDTDTAHAAYRQLDVVPMKAWIDHSAEAKAWHKKLNGFGVPHLAIFPGDRPNEPELLEGMMTQATLLDLLEKATGRPFVPGGGEPDAVRTAAR